MCVAPIFREISPNISSMYVKLLHVSLALYLIRILDACCIPIAGIEMSCFIWCSAYALSKFTSFSGGVDMYARHGAHKMDRTSRGILREYIEGHYMRSFVDNPVSE